MEGSVVDERIGNKRRERDEEEGNVGRLEKRPSGMMVMEEYSYSGNEMINGVKYEEEEEKKEATNGGGGLFNQLITNLVSSPRSNQKVESDGQPEINNGDCRNHGESGTTEGGGGVFKHMISNMFTRNGGEEVVDADGGGSAVRDDDGGSGSIVGNIVAQLPSTLSEDRVPATDEASILIHSIIHD